MPHIKTTPPTNPLLHAALVALGWAIFRDLLSSIPLSELLFEAVEFVGCYLAIDEARHRFRITTSLHAAATSAMLPATS